MRFKVGAAEFQPSHEGNPSDPVLQSAATERDAAEATRKPPQNAAAVRILIAERETIFRESLGFLLELARGFEVVSSCADAEELLAAVQSSMVDVLLLDSGIGPDQGVDVLRELKRLDLAAKVVLLCPAVSREEVIGFLRLGARGIVLRSEPVDTLVQCLGKVARGEYWLGNESVTDLVQVLSESGNGKPKWENSYGLTVRENQIVAEVLQGYSNREIAESLAMSEHTVKHHLSSIFDKLGVYSRLELALFAVNHPLVPK